MVCVGREATPGSSQVFPQRCGSCSTRLWTDQSCWEQKLRAVSNNWAASVSLLAGHSSPAGYFRSLFEEHDVAFQYLLPFPWNLLVSDLRAWLLKTKKQAGACSISVLFSVSASSLLRPWELGWIDGVSSQSHTTWCFFSICIHYKHKWLIRYWFGTHKAAKNLTLTLTATLLF